MIVKRKSPLTGLVHEMDLPITDEQIERYARGALLQVAFPNLSNAEREFYKTGYTPSDWETMFPPDEGDEQ